MAFLHSFSKKRPTFTGTLITAFVIFSLFVMLGPVLFLIYSNYSEKQGQIAVHVNMLAEETADSFDVFLKNHVHVLETALWLGGIGWQSEAELRIFLSRLLGRFESYRQAAYYDSGGSLVASLSIPGRHEARRFLDAMAGYVGSPAASNIFTISRIHPIFLDEATNEPHAVVTIPVFGSHGEYLGLFGAEMSMRFIWGLIADRQIPYNGYAYIIDQNERLIAHRDSIRVRRGERVSSLPIVRAYKQLGTGIRLDRYTGLNGFDVSGILVPLTGSDWKVVVEIPRSELQAILSRQLFRSSLLGLVMVLLAAICGHYLARRMSGPVEAISNQTSKIAAGELLHIPEIRAAREIHSLRDAINSMSSQLHAALESLKIQLEAAYRSQSELTETHSRLTALVENSPAAIIMTDHKGYVKIWNKAAEIIYGWKTEEILDKQISDIADESGMEFSALSSEVSVNSSGIQGREVQRWRKDGTEIWLNLSVAPLLNEKGEVSALFSIAVDISSKKSAEKLIFESLQEKDIYLKELHHRVKNNMQIIISLLDLQGAACDDSVVGHIILETRQRIKSMALIHEVLYIQKNLASIDLEAYVASLVRDTMAAWPGASERIAVVVDVQKLIVGIGMAVPCGLMINEILSNAIQHAFPGNSGGEVRISFTVQNDGYVCIQISDNGVGMPPGNLDSGTLGLTLVRELANQIEARISLETTNGVHYRILLPSEQLGRA